MIKVAAYIRVSTDGQAGDDKFGLDAQKEQIIEYCAKHDMEIIKWFADEGESGAKERPGFDAIIYGEVTNPPYEAVVVAKSDRVARDINIYFYYKMMLNKKDIRLISIAEDFGQFGVFANMLEAFTLCVAEMERENITKRTSGGRAIKAAQGGYAGGKPPFGYRVVSGCLVVNKDESDIVRRIFDLHSQGLVLRKICDVLNTEGVKTRTGGKYFASTIKAILDNEPTYRGMYHYGKNGEWVQGQHEPILK